MFSNFASHSLLLCCFILSNAKQQTKQGDVGFIYGHQSNCSPNINIGHWKSHNNQPLKTYLSGISSVFTALLWTGLREIENIILEKSVHTLALSKCFARVPGCMNRWINVNYSDTSTFEFRCLTWPAAFGFIQKCLAKIQCLTSSCNSNVYCCINANFWGRACAPLAPLSACFHISLGHRDSRPAVCCKGCLNFGISLL